MSSFAPADFAEARRTFKPMKRSQMTITKKPARRVKGKNAHKEEQWKKAVRARDGYQCQFRGCWTRDRSIDAHHIAMRSRRPDLKFVHSNGISLCRTHHDWVHRNPIDAERLGLLSSETYEKR